MKQLNLIALFITGFTLVCCTAKNGNEEAVGPSEVLWYSQPAETWTEALPLGNGRLGAMVYGGTNEEVIQFNEETLWSGQPHSYANEGAHEYLDEIRRLLWEGRQEEAHRLGNEQFMSQPFGQLCYLPFGNIIMQFPGHENAVNYKRQLNLNNAVSSVQYEVGGVQFKREIFASAPQQALVVRLKANKKGAISFTFGLDSPHDNFETNVSGNEVILTGKANNYPKELGRDGNPYPESKLHFEARVKAVAEGGEINQSGNLLSVENASSVTLYLAAATSFESYNNINGDPTTKCKKVLEGLEGVSYRDLKARHIADYGKLYNRVEIDLGESDISERPTDERLVSFMQDEDPSLVALLYQYGRYLLISSSRPGTQPANLQGIWNDKMAPPWDSKYTININTEMNYWPAEITNLSELTEPLIKMVEELSETGKEVAREHYNMDGWVTHHNTDIWRGAAPINNANHGIWVTGGAWLSQHLWWHYQFTGDKEYLRNRAYPVLKEASRFFVSYLVPDPGNPQWLVSGPSNSPEIGGLVMAPTMDHQIIRTLLGNTIEAAEILNVDAEFANILRDKKNKIAPNLIGRHGQLQEWLIDKDDPENKHRHVSHLWGLHPGNEIHPATTPDLADACRVTLSHRGDGGTGWSRAWKINFWARLLDGDHSFLLLKNLMVPSVTQETNMRDKGGLYLNLFDAHPPFQIDGNFGATSGITEMLLQSHLRTNDGGFYQDILPALPSGLPSGKISGIKGRGGFEFNILWNNGELVTVEVISHLGNGLHIRYNGGDVYKPTEPGEKIQFTADDFAGS